MSSPSVARGTTVEQLVNDITEMVLTGELNAGEVLIESEIAIRFNVSRTPIREAISQLVARGILVKENRHSAKVQRPSLDDLQEIYTMRILLETYVANRAAEEATPKQKEHLAEAERRLASSDESRDEWFRLHTGYHGYVFECARLPRFRSTIEVLQHQAEPYVRMVTQLDTGRRASVREEHRALLAAIVDGDGERAAQVTRQHLTSTVERVSCLFRVMTKL